MWRSVSAPLAPVWGRGDVVDDVCQRLRQHRWVSLAGAAGMGKSTVAQVVGARFADDDTPVFVAQVSHQAWTSCDDALQAFPAVPDAVLIADGVPDDDDDWWNALRAWLEQQPTRRVLTTSRAPVQLAGVAVVGVGLLDEEASRSLLRQRLEEWGCPPLDDDVAHALVAWGDGWPLALEVLAAQLTAVHSEELLAFGSNATRRLQLSARGGPLHDALATSWQLLDTEAQRKLPRVVVLPDEASLDDITVVTGLTLVQVQALVTRSWLLRSTSGGPSRYRLPQPVRDFLSLHLDDGDADATRRRWLDVLVARQTAPSTPWVGLPDGVSHLQASTDDKRALLSLVRSTLTSSPDVALRAWCAALPYVLQQGPYVDALQWARRLEDVAGASDVSLAQGAAWLALWTHDLDDAERRFANLQDDAALNALGRAECARRRRNTDDALAAYAEARHHADGLTAALVDERLAGLLVEQHRLFEALQLYHDAYAAYLVVEHGGAAARVQQSVALVSQELGDLDAAEALLLDAADGLQTAGDLRFAAVALGDLGALHLEQRRLRDAERLLRQARADLLVVGDGRQALFVQSLCAAAVGLQGDFDGATALFDDVDRQRRGFASAEVYDDALERHRLLVASPMRAPTRAAGSDEARAADRLLHLWHRREDAIDVSEDGCHAQLPDGVEVTLTSKAAGVLLATLVKAHLACPGQTVTYDALFAAAWPPPAVLNASGRNRLHVALSTLRRSGLRGVIDKRDDGYALQPHLVARLRTTSSS